MTTGVAVILATVIYKMACLTVGSLSCAMGYQLFKRGIWGAAGDMESKFKDLRIVLRGAAPGTFFAVLGSAIVVVTVWQGLRFNWESASGNGPDISVTPPPLPNSDGVSK